MSAPDARNPLIVQGDHSILVEVDNPRYGEARDRLVRFAELVKSPEHIHTYRLTPLSIWNACAAGLTAKLITDSLTDLAKYSVPEHVLVSVRDFASRYGRVQVTPDLKMRGYTAGKTKRFKSLNLSEFPSAACVGTFGPPRARGPTRLAASGFHVHLQFHL